MSSTKVSLHQGKLKGQCRDTRMTFYPVRYCFRDLKNCLRTCLHFFDFPSKYQDLFKWRPQNINPVYWLAGILASMYTRTAHAILECAAERQDTEVYENMLRQAFLVSITSPLLSAACQYIPCAPVRLNLECVMTWAENIELRLCVCVCVCDAKQIWMACSIC